MTAPQWLDALAWCAEDNGFGTRGTDIFVGRRSDDTSLPDDTTVLTEVPGAVDENMGRGGDVFRPMFNIYVRGEVQGYAGARAKVLGLFQLYTAVLATTIHGVGFLRIGNPGVTPTYLGRDDNERPEFSVDLWTWQPPLTVPGFTYAP